MTIKRTLLFVLAVVFTTALAALLFFQDLIHKVRAQIKVSANTKDQCTDDVLSAMEPKNNPNKVLFISCGGFWD